MKKNYISLMYLNLLFKYQKLSNRIQRSIKSGKFWTLSKLRRDDLLNRIQVLKLRLQSMNPQLAKTLVIGGLLVGSSAVAQTNFVKQTGADNPAAGIVVQSGAYGSASSFADLDNDGDLDMVFSSVGDIYTVEMRMLEYYKNTGSATNPIFLKQEGVDNPFQNLTFDLGYLTPSFGDFDGDGDFDLLVGGDYNTLKYFKNTGTLTTPVFVEQLPGYGSIVPVIPYSGGFSLDELAPSCVDIDGDGDLDVFLAEEIHFSMFFLKNNGTPTVPDLVFIDSMSVGNPFNGLNPIPIANYIRVEAGFGDIDGDGDFDAFLSGGYSSNTGAAYYRNDGTATVPNFVLSTEEENPFKDFVRDGYAYPSFVDIDADGDLDFFVGDGSSVAFYKNLDINTSTKEVVSDFSSSISVFPNPCKSDLTVSVKDIEAGVVSVSLLDSKGLEVLKTVSSTTEFKLDLSNLSGGVYILKLNSPNASGTVKVIKE